MASKKEKGDLGESAVCEYLENKGYTIKARDYRRRCGEIDIVASKAGVLSFIEVKTRCSSRYGKPVEAVTLAKQRKIYRVAQYYLQCAGLISRIPMLSFDVIDIIIEGGAVMRLFHYPHCF